MIVWIDGTYGIGKTTITRNLCKTLKESYPWLLVELVISDDYHEKYCADLSEAQQLRILTSGGLGTPQEDIDFIREFRSVVLEKSSIPNSITIVDMALTHEICNTHLFNYLLQQGCSMQRFILEADEGELKRRILESDRPDEEKPVALAKLSDSIRLLSREFNNAKKLNTTGKSISEITQNIIDLLSATLRFQANPTSSTNN